MPWQSTISLANYIWSFSLIRANYKFKMKLEENSLAQGSCLAIFAASPAILLIFLLKHIFFFQILELNEKTGQVKLTSIGSDLVGDNQQLQYTVPRNVWFGAFPTKDYNISPDSMVAKTAPRDAESHYSLVGCTCAPAFQFEDFELAKRSYLISRFPNYEPLISLLTLPEWRWSLGLAAVFFCKEINEQYRVEAYKGDGDRILWCISRVNKLISTELSMEYVSHWAAQLE